MTLVLKKSRNFAIMVTFSPQEVRDIFLTILLEQVSVHI